MKEIDVSKYFKPNLKNARKRVNKDTLVSNFVLLDKYKDLGVGKTYTVITYGCQANEADSEVFSGILENLGYERDILENSSDLVIINTCAIRENAEDRTFGELGRLMKYKRKNPNMITILAGCMSQEEKVVERVLQVYPQVDIIIGTHNIYKLPEYIYNSLFSHERIVEVFSEEGSIIEQLPKIRENKHKAWVNIMYGCDEFCTYCIVPYTRGKERSRQKEEIIKEVLELIESGCIEITLLGQNVNAYGKDFKEINYTFKDLLSDLAKLPIKRIRFTTSHPKDLDFETIKVLGSFDNIMPYLHLPVQSGSNSILKKMNRHYTIEEYLEKVNYLKKEIPNVSLTTDIIVGFPNETEEDFLKTLELVDTVKFEGAYTFIYSKRDGTPAATFIDSISDLEKKDRFNRLKEVVDKYYLRGNQRFLGLIEEVLVDEVSKGNEFNLTGYTKNNKRVNFQGDKNLVGTLVNVKITSAKTWFLMGEIVDNVTYLKYLMASDPKIIRFRKLEELINNDPIFKNKINEVKSVQRRRKLNETDENKKKLDETIAVFMDYPLVREYFDLFDYAKELIDTIKNIIETELSKDITLER
ncbi:MAG: tRNA (N6-isopentenyl adenosine(37)-C2)-methylthiotransferase MiaB [Acholeplasmatales bacterium]|jgi:tRNA-2-methylthio-N6-dimethylallyladenosine synthase|nr:tRNA (N6-isopentenyl adenosine(37)-C2)-methylthiotransferase MiaB [Acholeplasmatales bacterium]